MPARLLEIGGGEMKKPFVVIDTDKVRVTDLRDGTSEIWDKEKNTIEIYKNSDIVATLLEERETKNFIPVTAYEHKGH